MIRLLRLSRNVPRCRQFLHTIKSRELDEPAYFRKTIDPEIVALVKKYDPDIFYSSYIELNKKSLSLLQRKEIVQNINKQEYSDRLNKARETEPSVLVEKLNRFADAKLNDKTPLEAKSMESPIISADKPVNEQNEAEKLKLARSKLKILTEMGLRRSAIEYEMQSFPDNWMEDYETYDENDYTTDTHYGTAGMQHIFHFHFFSSVN